LLADEFATNQDRYLLFFINDADADFVEIFFILAVCLLRLRTQKSLFPPICAWRADPFMWPKSFKAE
jgi:hypothetical protein